MAVTDIVNVIVIIRPDNKIKLVTIMYIQYLFTVIQISKMKIIYMFFYKLI